ncbi:PD-(D/E)XK nuclease family protein [Ornithinimicrobium faecis]|uniref:PD-(D/E)XK nuclease family protein n=1 Tax=Ornithinimicrobium faecis TaxID=2934158 RepID=UPI002118E5FF|nr:PD-(D/E)XK nuclease family protein [Ornithinimicrobium sp. HY1745]
MNALDWHQPEPAPLLRLSPTHANALLACQKQAAFRGDPSTADLSRPSTRTALGSAAHTLIECVLTGEVPPPEERRKWLESKWEAAIQDEALSLAQAWPDRVIPTTRTWPGLTATRRRLIKRLEQLSPVAPRAKDVNAPQNSDHIPALPWVERWIEDPVTGLIGKPDLITEAQGRIQVVDHKTGVHQDGIREGQRRQLLIYAHLASVALGHLPDEAIVLDARGREEGFEINANEVEETVKAAVAALRDFEASRSAGSFTASPSPEICRYCPYRTVCLDYWTARDSSETVDNWSANDLRGVAIPHQVDNVVTVASGEINVQVVLTAGVYLDKETELVATDLDRNGAHGARMRWNSLIRTASTSNAPKLTSEETLGRP